MTRESKKIISAYKKGERDFRGISLKNYNLKNINLSGANLVKADFSGAVLRGANFRGAKLEKAIFSDSFIEGANFTNADLNNSNFRGVNAGLQPYWIKILLASLCVLLMLSGFPMSIAGWWGTYVSLPSTIQVSYIPLIANIIACLIFFGIIIFEITESIEADVIAIFIIAFVIVALASFPTIVLNQGSAALSVAIPVLVTTIGIASSIAAASVLAAIKIISTKSVTYLTFAFAIIVNAVLVGLSAYSVDSSRATVAAIAIVEAGYDYVAVITTSIGGATSLLLSAFVCNRILQGSERYELSSNLVNVLVATLKSTNFRGSDLTDADFRESNLRFVDFRNTKINITNITRTNWHEVSGLVYIRPGSTYLKLLKDPSIRNLIIKKTAVGQCFKGMNLQGINLSNADLSAIDLVDANLSDANLCNANLSYSKLVRVQLANTNLTDACLNGACIEDLGNTKTTKLDRIYADSVYMLFPDKRKQPNDKSEFENSEELIALIEKRSDIIELYHTHGLNINACQFAVGEAKRDNPNMVMGITSYRKVDKDKYLVSLQVSPHADEIEIEKKYHSSYQQVLNLSPEYQEIYLSISRENLGQFANLLPVNQVLKENRVRLIVEGDFANGFPYVRLEVILAKQGKLPISDKGSLPSALMLENVSNSLFKLYRALARPSLPSIRTMKLIETEGIEEIKDDDHLSNLSRIDLESQSLELQKLLNSWLKSPLVLPIYKLIEENLSPEEEFLICIENDSCPSLRSFPWHSWEILRKYKHAEVAFSKGKSLRRSRPGIRTKPRILCILGDDKDIDVEKDKSFLSEYLGESDLVFLSKPNREEFFQHLRHVDGWDIISFSGHGSEQWDTLLINSEPQGKVEIETLKIELNTILDKGLQLLILNSCNSLHLAQALEDVCIPHVIAMRDSVPDSVAQTFLKSFLKAFSSGRSVGGAVRQAREELDSLKKSYPLASWMPVLCQNFAEFSVTWTDLPRIN